MIKLYTVRFFAVCPNILYQNDCPERKMAKRRLALPVCAAAFAFAAALSALICRMIISDVKVSPITPDLSSVSPSDVLGLAASVSKSSCIQLGIMYLSSFSVFTLPACALVMFFRGAALGYTAGLAVSGRLVTVNESVTVFGLSVGTVPLALGIYASVSVVMLIFAYVSTAYSENRGHGTLKYTTLFLVLTGISSALDVLRTVLTS